MNILESFSNDDKLIEAVQGMLLKFLSARTKLTVTAGAPTHQKTEKPWPVFSLCMLRFNQKENIAPMIIGSSQPDFQEAFYKLIASDAGTAGTGVPDAGAPPLDPKAIENELIKTLFATLDVAFKKNGVQLDPKAAIPITQKTLGGWASVHARRSVQLPFTTADGELVFEIPVLSEEYAHEKMLDIYGFPHDTRILAVDDSITTRKLVHHILASAGYLYVEECEDGLAGYNKILMANPRFNLIVADWHMPKMTGIELLKKIRTCKEEQVKRLPVLLVTGERNQEEVINAIREGVSGYVVKPFDGETLYAAMKKASKLRHSGEAVA